MIRPGCQHSQMHRACHRFHFAKERNLPVCMSPLLWIHPCKPRISIAVYIISKLTCSRWKLKNLKLVTFCFISSLLIKDSERAKIHLLVGRLPEMSGIVRGILDYGWQLICPIWNSSGPSFQSQCRRPIMGYCDRTKTHTNVARDMAVDDGARFGAPPSGFWKCEIKAFWAA